MIPDADCPSRAFPVAGAAFGARAIAITYYIFVAAGSAAITIGLPTYLRQARSADTLDVNLSLSTDRCVDIKAHRRPDLGVAEGQIAIVTCAVRTT